MYIKRGKIPSGGFLENEDQRPKTLEKRRRPRKNRKNKTKIHRGNMAWLFTGYQFSFPINERKTNKTSSCMLSASKKNIRKNKKVWGRGGGGLPWISLLKEKSSDQAGAQCAQNYGPVAVRKLLFVSPPNHQALRSLFPSFRKAM